MASKLVQPQPMAASHVCPSLSSAMEIMRTHSRPLSTTQPPWNKRMSGLGDQPIGPRRPICLAAKAAEQSYELVSDHICVEKLKAQLYDALQGINRGIFGVQSAKKAEIEEVVKMLESQNPTPEPTMELDKVSGNWKLVYSTITILGAKRTKLGLRDFTALGDFWQIIDVTEGKAVNVIKFSAKGFSFLSGQLQIVASFKIASKSRVDISYSSSTITPDQLMNLFKKNYDLLLSIFNPDGWLEITYVDDSLRIGRDDKGNIFILERSQEEP